MSGTVTGRVISPHGKRPAPWLADMIAAAYTGDDTAILEAAGHLTAAERRDLDHVLMVLVRALLTERLRASAQRRITLTVEPEDG